MATTTTLASSVAAVAYDGLRRQRLFRHVENNNQFGIEVLVRRHPLAPPVV